MVQVYEQVMEITLAMVSKTEQDLDELMNLEFLIVLILRKNKAKMHKIPVQLQWLNQQIMGLSRKTEPEINTGSNVQLNNKQIMRNRVKMRQIIKHSKQPNNKQRKMQRFNSKWFSNSGITSNNKKQRLANKLPNSSNKRRLSNKLNSSRRPRVSIIITHRNKRTDITEIDTIKNSLARFQKEILLGFIIISNQLYLSFRALKADNIETVSITSCRAAPNNAGITPVLAININTTQMTIPINTD